jgi:hypothetical protein
MSAGDFKIREGTLEEKDVEAIVHQRRAMFFDMGHRDERALKSMSEKFRPWVKRKMEAGEYLAWFAIAPDESVAAGAGLWLWCAREGVGTVILHASDEGRPLYEKLGFEATNEMSLKR